VLHELKIVEAPFTVLLSSPGSYLRREEPKDIRCYPIASQNSFLNLVLEDQQLIDTSGHLLSKQIPTIQFVLLDWKHYSDQVGCRLVAYLHNPLHMYLYSLYQADSPMENTRLWVSYTTTKSLSGKQVCKRGRLANRDINFAKAIEH